MTMPTAPYAPGPKREEFRWDKYVYKRWAASARRRGIVVELTFEQFMEAWGDHWKHREVNDLVLARRGDTGPYAVGNIYITTRGQNVRDAFRYRAEETRRVSTVCPQGQPTERAEFSHFARRFCAPL